MPGALVGKMHIKCNTVSGLAVAGLDMATPLLSLVVVLVALLTLFETRACQPGMQ